MIKKGHQDVVSLGVCNSVRQAKGLFLDAPQTWIGHVCKAQSAANQLAQKLKEEQAKWRQQLAGAQQALGMKQKELNSALHTIGNLKQRGMDEIARAEADKRNWKAIESSRRDISLQPLSANFHRPAYPGKVWLVNYAKGDAYHKNAQFQMYSALNRGVHAMIAYSETDLDEAFKKKNAHILAQPRGAGYWLWKPYLILKMLDMIPEGEVVLYLDAGACVAKDISPYLALLNQHDAVFFENDHINRPYMKRDCYELMGLGTQVLDQSQLDASRIFCKKNPRTQAFMEKWLRYMEDARISTDQPSAKPEDPAFQDHRHDQAVLTLCMYQEEAKAANNPERLQYHMLHQLTAAQNGQSPWPRDGIFCHHRRRTLVRSLHAVCPQA